MTSATNETQNEKGSSILPFRLPSLGAEPESEKTIFLIVIALAIYSVVRNLAQAAVKPPWFDEILTQVVARQPNFSAIWNALKAGVDGNPPLFYLIERVASHLSSNEMLAFRLVSALAFACTFICLYIFVERRSGARVAFICAVLIFVTPLNNKYSLEARPYSLLVGLSSACSGVLSAFACGAMDGGTAPEFELCGKPPLLCRPRLFSFLSR